MKKQWDFLHEPQLSSLQKYVDDKDRLSEMDLAKKVFEIYATHYRILNWNEFFSLRVLNVGKLSINLISKELKISRETARRKIYELINGFIYLI